MNWVSNVRLNFPKIKIITGVWVDKIPMISPLILSGSNVITKFPVFSVFGTKKAHWIEKEILSTGRELIGTFTDIEVLKGEKVLEKTPYIEEEINISKENIRKVEELKDKIDEKINSYISKVLKKVIQ